MGPRTGARGPGAPLPPPEPPARDSRGQRPAACRLRHRRRRSDARDVSPQLTGIRRRTVVGGRVHRGHPGPGIGTQSRGAGLLRRGPGVPLHRGFFRGLTCLPLGRLGSRRWTPGSSSRQHVRAPPPRSSGSRRVGPGTRTPAGPRWVGGSPHRLGWGVGSGLPSRQAHRDQSGRRRRLRVGRRPAPADTKSLPLRQLGAGLAAFSSPWNRSASRCE